MTSSVTTWWFQVPQADLVRIEPVQPRPWWEVPLMLLTAATSIGLLGSAAYIAGLRQLGEHLFILLFSLVIVVREGLEHF